MKKTRFIPYVTFASALLLGVTACNGGGGDTPVTPVAKFSFSLSLKSKSNSLYVGEEDFILINEINADPAATYTYTVTLAGIDNPDTYLEWSLEGKQIRLNPLKATGKDENNVDRYINISVKEASVRAPKTVSYAIINRSEDADGGYNYASSSSAEAKAERTKILGELEKYAVENYLTGITLFENGGWTRYSKRITIPATEYITGYGWGILAEGKINGKLDGVEDHPYHLQSASSSDPLSLNAWDAAGSQVSDLNSYISASYWGTRMKIGSTTEYEWYPLLAKDFITDPSTGKQVKFNRPVTTEPKNGLNMYKRWRVYVKTGAEDGLQYRTASTDAKMSLYNNRDVELEDYETTLQMLLSEESGVLRGAELAGDTSYGIKGGQAYFNRTKDKKDEIVNMVIDGVETPVRQLDKIWNDMKESGDLGIATGSDDNGSYIEIELVNPIDEFTAMYTLSSNLYTPIPKAFLREIGGDDFTAGARLYGTFPDVNTDVRDLTLCIGPYYLEEYTKNSQIIFTRNDEWFEYKNKATLDPTDPAGKKKLYGDRYNIDGVRIRTITAMSENDEALWNYFTETKEVDSTNIPKSKMSEIGNGNGQDRKSEGDATFKLNVNSCSQDRWNELFGDKGSIEALGDNAYLVKPWMSNKNFLKGLYWSINRKGFAEKRGVNPSYNYFSGSYLSDPENGVSYNSTDEHAAAVANFHNGTGENDDYGYDVKTARNAFRDAINELKLEVGTESNPKTISIDIIWMYPSDETSYGNDIINDLETAFNGDATTPGAMTGIKLKVNQDHVEKWEDVYYKYLMLGKYDLGFGAISGNTYNPLNFMEVLKSDNSSGFTLNWGVDTSKVDEINPIVYDGKTWSYDALWAAADHGTVVKGGRDVNPIANCFLSTVSTNDLYEGGTFLLPFSFVELENAGSVEFSVLRIQIFLSGYGNVLVEKYDPNKAQDYYYEEVEGGYKITITAHGGSVINQNLIDYNDLQKQIDKETDPVKKDELEHPFRYSRYGLWYVEVYYSMAIVKDGKAGIPSETSFVAYMNESEQEDHKKQ